MRRVWIAALVLASACSWVQLSEGGRGVHVGTAAEVVDCDKTGTARVSTRDTVAIFARSSRRVQEELENLARNEAAGELGGDTVVPRGPVEDGGRQSFDVYLCR